MKRIYTLVAMATFLLTLICSNATQAQNSRPIGYCGAGSQDGSTYNISGVFLNTINNYSSSTAGYENFTALTTDLQAGSVDNDMIVSNRFYDIDYTQPYTITVYIDYNQDLDFDDANEKIYQGAGGSNDDEFFFDVPANGVVGSTRMRVRLDYDGGANTTPCGISAWGQVEDYTVNITAGPCQPNGSDTSVTACNSYTWNGITYYNTGDKIFTTTNVAGCDSVATLHLTIKTIANTFSAINAVCNGSATGSITLTPTSGQSPYSYRIGTTGGYTSGGSSYTFSNLKAGTYRAYVQDGTGCIGVAGGIVVSQKDKVTATATGTPTNCTGPANGTITIDNPVGTAPFRYKIGSTGNVNPFVAPYTIMGLVAGTYRIYVIDADGCSSAGISASVTQPLPTVYYSVVQPTCSTPTGTITLSCSDVDGVTYKLSPGSSIYQTQKVYSGLVPGTYYGYAKNALGCIGRSSAIVLSAATGCSTLMAKGTQQSTNETATTTLSASISPNPSRNVFKLTPHTPKAEAIQLRVLDVNGKVVYTAKGSPTQSFTFGEALTVGIYMIELRQRSDVKTYKVVKTL